MASNMQSSTRGQYRALPSNINPQNNTDIAPTKWESFKDAAQGCYNRFIVPALVLVSSIIVILLVVILITGPKSRESFPADNADGSPIIIEPGQKGLWNDVRLPKSVLPVHYELDFTTFLDGEHNSSFSGIVALEVNITTATLFFVIHASELNVTDVEMTVSSDKKLTPVRHEIHTERGYHVFKFEEMLPVGISKFTSKYRGTLGRSLRGYYLSKYYDQKGFVNWLASTQFESTDARKSFPCLDEPAMKATFAITMTTQSQFHAISNMDLLAPATSHALGTKTYRFETTPRMSTYLVAFVVSDFESVQTKTKRGIKVSVWTAPGRTAMGEYAARTAALIIDHYENVLGVEYPLPKSDQIAIPDFAAGAMENWGLITYRDTALLLGPNSTPVNKQRVATVIAHELAHQWFGNLVTLGWWSELYLNEGFATFMEYFGTDAAEPSFDMANQFYRADQVRAMIADANIHTRPLHAVIDDPHQIEGIFDAISYSKGASLISMIQNFIEDQGHSFFGGIRQYLDIYAYGNTEGTDLWNIISTHAGGVNITRLVDEWLTRPGYPLITVVNPTASTSLIGRGSVPLALKITQERSLGFSGRDSDLKNQSVWQIPVTYQVWSNDTGIPQPLTPKVQSALFTTKERELALVETQYESSDVKETHWVIKMNVGQHGLYRVSLPPSMLLTVSEWWRSDPNLWTPVDRAGILEDGMDRLMAGDKDVDVDVTLGLLHSLAGDSTYAVWSVAMDRLSMIMKLLDCEPHYITVRRVLAELIDQRVRDLGWHEDGAAPKQQESTHVRSLLRTQLLGFASRVGHQATIHQAQAYFEELMKHTTSSIETAVHQLRKKRHLHRLAPLGVALVPIVVNSAVRNGGEEQYLLCEKRFNEITITADALVYLRAMSQTTVPHLVSRNVALALSPAIRGQDKVRFLTWVTNSSPNAAPLVANYLEEHYDEFMNVLGRGGAFSSARELIEVLSKSAASEGDIARIQDLFDPKHRTKLPPSTQEAMDKGFVVAREGIAWRHVLGQRVVDWFVDQAPV